MKELEKGTLRAQVDAAEALITSRETLEAIREDLGSLSPGRGADAAGPEGA